MTVKRSLSHSQETAIFFTQMRLKEYPFQIILEVLCTSHMVEHLDRDEVISFLKEACRILAPNGIIRIVVPDLKKLLINILPMVTQMPLLKIPSYTDGDRRHYLIKSDISSQEIEIIYGCMIAPQ